MSNIRDFKDKVTGLLGGHDASYFATNTHDHDADYLQQDNNLSDLDNAATAKSNIGLGNVPNVDCTDASNITSGTLPSNVLPNLSISSVQIAANETAMLALTTEQGDSVVRTDENKTYIHNGGSAGTMADFTEILTPEDGVTSVNGESGPTVVLTLDDIGDGSTYVKSDENFTMTLLQKLNGIEDSADVNPTASEILTDILTVDGSGSGLDADLLDSMQPTTTAAANTIAQRDASGDLTANKVYNAVYNDIADHLPLLDDEIQYGKCYRYSDEGGATLCDGYMQKGVIGMASDTFGFGVGENKEVKQVPIAIGGFVLAYLDESYKYMSGDCLTNDANGFLTLMSDTDKRNYPERIVATYMRKETEKTYGVNNEINVDGRHWVKVK